MTVENSTISFCAIKKYSKILDCIGEERDDSYEIEYYTNHEPTSEASDEHSTDPEYSKASSLIETLFK